MLNYILPPIIIIISISILIMFLFRKAAQIPAGEFVADEYRGDRVKIMSAIGQLGLKLLERLMHRAKLLSLKFHNVSNMWFQTIREKRQQSVRSAQIQKEAQEQKIEQNVGDSIIQSDASVLQEKQAPRPMIGMDATMPQQTRMIERNKLEEALIKRIAINPRDIEAYERLGDYYLENENFQDSLECFKQVLRLSPAHHKAKLRIRRLERIR